MAAGGNLDVAVAQYGSIRADTRIVAGYWHRGQPADGFEIVELLPVQQAVCGAHVGDMAGAAATWHQLMTFLEVNRLQPEGVCRENCVRVEGDDQSDWVVELQQQVRHRTPQR